MQTALDDSRFNIIAQSYEYAIATYPDARKDGDWLISSMEIKEDDTILEISAGTGFLTEKIIKNIKSGFLYAQDIAPRTLELNQKKCGVHSNLKYITDIDAVKDNSCDKSVTLGGWHHMEDQISITRSAMSKLKKGGTFCVGDFSDNSSIQRYFDEVVDDITSTGHQALFPSKSRMINLGRFAEASNTEVEEFDVPFDFKNEDEVGEFFQKVFALDQPHEETYKDIEKYFDLQHSEGMISVMVPYIYARYTK